MVASEKLRCGYQPSSHTASQQVIGIVIGGLEYQRKWDWPIILVNDMVLVDFLSQQFPQSRFLMPWTGTNQCPGRSSLSRLRSKTHGGSAASGSRSKPTAFGPACPSNDASKSSEGCLCLKIWTSAGTAGAKLPAMVWNQGSDETRDNTWWVWRRYGSEGCDSHYLQSP